VPAAHQVPEFAFDLWSGGPVLGLPGRILLGGAGPGQLGLVATNTDGAPGLRGRARGGQRATAASGPEGRGTTAGLGRSDGHGDVGWAGHGPGTQIDDEAVLGEPPARRDRRLHLGQDVGAGLFQLLQQSTGAVGCVAVDRQRRLRRGGALGLAVRALSDWLFAAGSMP